MDLKQIADNLIKGKAPEVKELVQKAVDEGIDVEKVLNEGLVAGEVKERIKFLAPGGGFILGPSQDFLPDIPTKNIITMYETARRYGRYPIRL